MKHLTGIGKLFFGAALLALMAFAVTAQTKSAPKVTQIDEAGLKAALKNNGRPMLVNFWATWCDPCREEFPDLVKIDGEYKGKIDFLTISLDDPAEIKRDVPQFLAEMKAEMPAYLLRVPDEGVVIGTITKDWQGGLPFTVLYDQTGKLAYIKQGKFKADVLRAEIDKLLAKKTETSKRLRESPGLAPRGAADEVAR